MNKNVIIGASGLIGSNLSKALVENSSVYAFSRSTINFKHPELYWFVDDLHDKKFINHIPTDANSIIYLAQSEYFREFPSRSLEIFDINVQCYLEILNYAVKHNIKNIIYASSGGVYAQKNKHFTEDDSITLSGELGFYLGSKICSELISSSFDSLLNLKILRFFFVYGQNQKKQMLIPRLLESINKGHTISLEGKNGIIINPLYVSDAVSAIQKTIELPNSEIYNVAGNISYNLREVCHIIGEILGKKPKFEVINFHEKSICGNTYKLNKLGWIPKVDLKQGIINIVDHIQKS